jgi:holliday junction DNA helicase RuvA
VISRVRGTLLARDLDRVEILTSTGLGYELAIPLAVLESLPRVGEEIELHAHLVVREDSWQLFGFSSLFEKRVFSRLMEASGVGPALALGILSALSAERVVRAIRENDVPTLQGVPRVGRKKAERIILDLADRLDDLAASEDGDGAPPRGAAAEDAVRGLVSLGYASSDAERAVRGAMEAQSGLAAAELLRAALSRLAARG